MFICFYILLIITGTLTVYTDIRQRRIKNIHLLIVLIAAVVCYIYFLASGVLKLSSSLLLNPLVGLLIGFALYIFGLWKPGDAKLFFIYSLLLPVNIYAKLLPLSCFVIFINTFLLAFLFALLISIKGIINNKGLIIKKVVSRKTLLYFTRIIFVVFSLSWVIEPIIAIFSSKSTPFINFILVFFGYMVIYRFIYRFLSSFKGKVIVIALFIAGLLVRFINNPEFFHPLNIFIFLKSIFIYSGILYFLRLLSSVQEESQKRIPFAPFMLAGTLLSTTPLLLKLLIFFKNIWS